MPEILGRWIHCRLIRLPFMLAGLIICLQLSPTKSKLVLLEALVNGCGLLERLKELRGQPVSKFA